MERVVPVLFVLQNSLTFYLTYIVILHVFLNSRFVYSEKSENIIGLDSYILNSFSYLSPI